MGVRRLENRVRDLFQVQLLREGVEPAEAGIVDVNHARRIE